MLVKINSINEGNNKAKVTVLDIDDYGSIIPLKDLELIIPSSDSSISTILKNCPYAAIFTEGDDYDNVNNNNTIILASGVTYDELDGEKKKTIEMTINKNRLT
jgi:hypothetical protein